MRAWWVGAISIGALVVAAWPTPAASSESSSPASVESPLSPGESLNHLVVEPGLVVELAAHEPQAVDPVAVRFDEDGRMWVVEMRDYPTGPKPGEPPRSRISVLEDRDGDGRFESAAVFADQLLFPTGLQPWRGGVFVTLAGEVVYMKDADGDGRADIRETWYTGFAEGNSQLRANHPRLGLDNYIYVANGLRGGVIRDAAHPERPAVSISGMDFRFNPLTRDFEAVSGVGQFGQTFDDYGNRFVCSNRNPAIHVVLESRFLQRNPLAAVAATSHDVAKAGADSRLYPIARSWTTSNLHAGQFTAACGVEVFRGDALGPDYYGNLFVCEPTGHLVHREVMRPKGATFESAPPRQGEEFLASRDEWFSPVNLETGPDGALYVVDMYRKVIEHPDWMPPELQGRPDQMEGDDRGRVYRVFASGRRAERTSKLSSLANERLVAELSSPNAWRRETAARLILERQDKCLGPLLRETARSSRSPVARIHAVWLLKGLGLIDDDDLLPLLTDSDPRLVEQGVAAAEGLVEESAALRDRIAQLAVHDDTRVRMAALLVSGAFPSAPRLPADQWERAALAVAAGSRGGEALACVLKSFRELHDPATASKVEQLVGELARLAAASRDHRQIALAMEALLADDKHSSPGLTNLLAAALQRGITADDIAKHVAPDVQRKLADVFDTAAATVRSVDRTEEVRRRALDLVALSPERADLVVSIALDDPSEVLRRQAIAALARDADDSVWRMLLARFPNETTATRTALLDAILAKSERASLLLDEFEAGRIRPVELGAAHLSRLLGQSDPAIKARAEKLAAAAIPGDRQRVLADYQAALAMTGDVRRGRQVFEQHCAGCHRIADIGVNVAPDISDSRERTAAQLLTDILQPNRAIDANYFNYTLATTGGLVHSGILTAETSTSVTLKQAEGKTVTVNRDEIEELKSTGLSLMPDGLERNISKSAMADLIAFIKNWRYLDDQTPLGQ